MLPTIATGNVASAIGGAYEVANSCMFNDGDTAYMHKTFGTGGSTTAWTMSMWVKRGALGTDQRVFSCDDSSDGDPDNYWRFTDDDEIQINIYNGSAIGNLITTRVFRDCSAWYHVCVIWKSADGTEGDRIQLWVNGIRETSFSTETYPSQNADSITASQVIAVGRRNNGPQQYFDGYLAEVVFLDGVTASPVDTLGEFDSDSPTIFKPKDPSGLSFGSTGFYLDFEDSANLGNDANGGTDLTEVNLAATDQAQDSPTNNFCVMNTLDKYWPTTGTAPAFSQGNLLVVGGSGSNSSTGYSYYTSTFGLAAGKWYWEVHITDIPVGGGQSLVGIIDVTQRYNQNLGEIVNATGIAWGIKNNGHVFNNNQGAAAETGTFVEGDTVGIALDITNSKIYFSKGGAWSDGNEAWDSTTFNAAVGAVDITAVGSTHNGYWFATVGGTEYSKTTTWTLNFGSPVISISSGNADENGYGNFEYAVPDGFLAVCTKNLGSAGG